MSEIQILNVGIGDAIRLSINDLVITAFMFAFLQKMYVQKYPRKITYIFAYFIAVIVSLTVACIGIPMLNGLNSLLLINILAVILYKVNVKTCILYNLCYTLMAIFGDIMSAAILSVLSGNTISQTIGSGLSMYVSSIVGWIVLLLSYRILITLFKKEERSVVKLKKLLFFVFITVLEVSITGYLLSLIEDASSGIILTIFLVCFFVLDIYITYLIHEAARSSQLKYELALSQQQVNMQLKHYKDMIIKQEKAQCVIHDAKKHIFAVEELFLKGQKEQAKEYTTQLFSRLDKLTFDFKCSNQILGIIISSKLQEGEERQIRLTPIIEDVSIDFINDLDVTAIFANLLDNSFEECCSLPTEIREVRFLLRKINNFLVINVTNPVQTVPVPINRVFKTSKEGHKGKGLSNVVTAVEKYNGNFIAEIENKNFVVSITIPIPIK